MCTPSEAGPFLVRSAAFPLPLTGLSPGFVVKEAVCVIVRARIYTNLYIFIQYIYLPAACEGLFADKKKEQLPLLPSLAQDLWYEKEKETFHRASVS